MTDSIFKDNEYSSESIGEVVDACIIELLSSELKTSYLRQIPLVDLGLDSLNLNSLRARLIHEVGIDLPLSFFFQYGSGQAVIDYLIEKKFKTYKDWLYQVDWSPTIAPSPQPFVNYRIWVIFQDEYDLSESLKKQLEENHQICILVNPGDTFRKQNKQVFEINPSFQEDYIRLFAAIPNISQLAGVIYLWGYNQPDIELSLSSIELYHKTYCLALIFIANAMAHINFPNQSRLWVVNQSLITDGTSISLLQSPLDVLSKVIREEYFKSNCIHIALDSKKSVDENCNFLCNEIRIKSREPQIAWREDKRLVSRIIPTEIKEIANISFQSNASYLVMGGLRPLGLKIARWYIEHGVKTLILLDELELTPELEKEIENLRKLGAKVISYTVDFDNVSLMELIFDKIKNQLPPLKGVIHCAGVADNELLIHMNWNRLVPTYRLKVAGSWNLHTFTKELDLDHFILFSTCFSDLSPLAKASHTTANTFLDALTYYRRKNGLPSLTINWAPWELFIAQRLVDTSLSSRFRTINIEDGLYLLEHVFYIDKPQIYIAEPDWMLLINRWMRDDPFLDEMAFKIGLKKDELLLKYQAADMDRRQDVIQSFIISELKKILGFDFRDTVRTDVPLSQNGADELQRKVLQTEIEKTIGYLPEDIVDLDPTIQELPRWIEEVVDEYIQLKGKTEEGEIEEPVAIIGMAQSESDFLLVLQDAGYVREMVKGKKIGVYDTEGSANLVSYTFDLHGPSENIDTSGFSILHSALRDLNSNECTMALVGNKSAVLLLKPLKEALKDRDMIHAVILGSCVRSGGRQLKEVAQAEVIRAAMKNAHVDAESISLKESNENGMAAIVKMIIQLKLHKGDPIRGAVSCFEKSGVNGHAILQGPPKIRNVVKQSSALLFPISSKKGQLHAQVASLNENLGRMIENDTPIDLRSIAYTLQTGRELFEERVIFIANSLEDLRKKMECFLKGGFDEATFYNESAKSEPPIGSFDTALETAENWVNWGNIDWNLYWPTKPQRMSLF